jgi:cell fate regulator YaaT (PSP1 superfamily)
MDDQTLTQAPEEPEIPVSAEDGLPEVSEPEQEENCWNIPRTTVVDVRFKDGGKVYYFAPGNLTIKTGDHVIVETARGIEFGFVANGLHQIPTRDVTTQLRPVVRLATNADERTRANNKAREKDAYNVCLSEIDRLGLDMQLASAEVAFDGSKILFFFTADGRVDFRELVKSLASAFHTRIELRQIGVRDKAKMIGGLGMCGRPFCCSEFLSDFQPVSIKMAKTQNLSLNPTKISGTCGRLMCCLKYEQEAYEDLIKTTPKAESFVDTPEGRGTVTDVNLLRQTVKVRMEKQPDQVQCFHNCDVCVWRNGKARKTDPPIPDDWAPISSDPNRRKEQPEEPTPAPQPFEPPAEQAKSGSHRNYRGGQNNRPKQEQSAQPQAEKSEKQGQKRPQQQQRSKQQKQFQPQQKQGQPKPQQNPPRKKPENAQAQAGDAPAEQAQRKRPNNRRRHRKPNGGNAKPQGGNQE